MFFTSMAIAFSNCWVISNGHIKM